MIVSEAIEAGKIEELTGYASLRREVKYGKNSRIDILLEDEARPKCYVEVKNTTMRRDLKAGAVEFPDAVTSRGAKHLLELADMVKEGHRAVMFYLVQREDADRFKVADDIDPAYAEGLTAALKAGVEVVCYACKLSAKEIVVTRKIKTEL
jgi:sugar fermentation stimulation protein A